jgi:hypothetical protein
MPPKINQSDRSIAPWRFPGSQRPRHTGRFTAGTGGGLARPRLKHLPRRAGARGEHYDILGACKYALAHTGRAGRASRLRSGPNLTRLRRTGFPMRRRKPAGRDTGGPRRCKEGQNSASTAANGQSHCPLQRKVAVRPMRDGVGPKSDWAWANGGRNIPLESWFLALSDGHLSRPPDRPVDLTYPNSPAPGYWSGLFYAA